jgi:hypothetical protein
MDFKLMGFILSYIAIVLFVIIYLLDEIIVMVINVRERKWFKTVSKRKYTKAFAIDVFANFLFPTTWTFLLSKKSGYKFGKLGETLSSVLGRKKIENSLNFFGKIIYYTLYAVDFSAWKKGGHCFASIMTENQINEFLNKQKRYELD